MDGLMDGWMGGWVDGWMEDFISIQWWLSVPYGYCSVECIFVDSKTMPFRIIHGNCFPSIT